jgi:hypothetical protein
LPPVASARFPIALKARFGSIARKHRRFARATLMSAADRFAGFAFAFWNSEKVGVAK